MMRWIRSSAAAAAAAAVAMAGSAWAQSELLRFDTTPYADASGWREGSDGPLRNEAGVINLAQRYATVLRADGANLVRVHFGTFDLGEHSEIRITSLQDGAAQRFTQRSLSEWDGWSAMFNGDAVRVQLLVAPGELAMFTITELAVNNPALPEAGEGGVAGADIGGLCGFDMRGPSSDSRVGRLSAMTCGGTGGGCGGCTGWLTSHGAVVTAGHCGGPGGVIEFNVPMSQANGMPVAANPDDQYPIAGEFYEFQDEGVGLDWAVLDVAPNSNTGLRAHWVQGYFHLASGLPGKGGTLRVTGCGVDNQPTGGNPSLCCDTNDEGDCTLAGCNSSSLTLQTATGPLLGTSGSAILLRVSAQPSNSGSPIIRTSNNFAVGVFTHGGCTSNPQTVNGGTRLTQSLMVDGLNNFLGGATFVDWANVGGLQVGTAMNPLRTVFAAVGEVGTGGVIALAGGSYTADAGNSGLITKACTINAVSGVATIGN